MSETASFNLVDVAGVLKRRWKPIAFFLTTVLIVTLLLLLFVMPKYYRSVSVVVPGNPVLSDKGRLFNKNIQLLYSPYGQAEDIDRLMAIAQLDTVYKTLVREFKLVNYCKLNEGLDVAEAKAVRQLKDDVTLEKTELNELRVKAVTKSAALSANLANRMVELVQSIAQRSWKNTYTNTIDQLNTSINLLKDTGEDSAAASLSTSIQGAHLRELHEQLHQYKVAVQTNSPALIVLERAYASPIVYRPKKLLVLAGALLAAFVFGVVAALMFDKKPVDA